MFVFFFFKQKTAYEMRISDWSSDVCSSDLRIEFPLRRKDIADIAGTTLHTVSRILVGWERRGLLISRNRQLALGRASSRDSVCPCVLISVVADSLKKKTVVPVHTNHLS